ncbi:MAG: DUF167 domain-containing protein [Crenarchaeota archaeon]|nr:DUF167 domain-containing protein [Thermoproteota archaeon]
MEEALRKLVTSGDGYVDILVYVKPESSFTGLRMEAGELVFYTDEPPLEGRANASLVRYIARLLGIPTSRVEIVYGQRSRTKRVRVYEVDEETVIQKIIEALRETEQR